MARKLNVAQVLDIVKRAKAGESADSLAEAFNVAPSTISRILSGGLWSRITGIR